MVAAIHVALGVALAIIQRTKSGEGQVVDVALYESVFNLFKGIVPEYDGAGVIREPSGSTLPVLSPPTPICAVMESTWLLVVTGTVSLRLMTEAGRKDMADDPELAHNPGRVVHQAKIDQAISEWCARHASDAIIATLRRRGYLLAPFTT